MSAPRSLRARIAIAAVGALAIAYAVAGLLLLSRDFRPDRVLTLKLTAIMLPYVLLICGGAFLSGILQVHKRFGPEFCARREAERPTPVARQDVLIGDQACT